MVSMLDAIHEEKKCKVDFVVQRKMKKKRNENSARESTTPFQLVASRLGCNGL